MQANVLPSSLRHANTEKEKQKKIINKEMDNFEKIFRIQLNFKKDQCCVKGQLGAQVN